MSTDAITTARATGQKIILVGVIGLAALPPLIALARGLPIWIYLGASGLLIALALIAARQQGAITRFSLTTALLGAVMGITAALAGHPWQLDSHMLYFAALAGVVVLVDIRALILGVALVAVQHLSLSVALPSLIYPAADLLTNLQRAALHGVILITEAAALIYAVWVRQKQVQQAETDQANVEHALEQARRAHIETEQAQAEQRAVVTALRENLARLADRDLSSRIAHPFPGEYEQLRTDYNGAVAELSDTIASVAARAVELADGVREITEASDDLSRRTETQAATLEQTAAALEEITSSVKSAAEGADTVERFVAETRDKARVSGEQVTTAVSAMTDIEKSSEQIAQIISVIDDIAYQTNLLSLNAGVEAARAGEAGKGFAVVATEVRALAQRSSAAALDIRDLITESKSQIDGGVEMVKQVGDSLMEIIERVNRISGFVGEIAQGTAEQAQGLQEINTGVSNLDQVTQQNAAMVEQNTAAAHSFGSHMSELRASMQRFALVRETEAQLTVKDAGERASQDRAADRLRPTG